MASLMATSRSGTGLALELLLALMTRVRSGRSTSIQWSPYQRCSLMVDGIVVSLGGVGGVVLRGVYNTGGVKPVDRVNLGSSVKLC